MDGSAEYDDDVLGAYLEEYLVPVTLRILEGLRAGGSVDYWVVAREGLSGGKR